MTIRSGGCGTRCTDLLDHPSIIQAPDVSTRMNGGIACGQAAGKTAKRATNKTKKAK